MKGTHHSPIRTKTPIRPNIIVFFSEGFSARAIGSYNETERFPDLTPNIDDFAQHSMVIKNYYNHTYATYRGLLGQLCSIYPIHGGHGGWDTHVERVKRVNYLCLSDLLNQADYETIFLDTHRKDAAFIDEMMHQLNFDTVITAEEIVADYGGDEPLRADSMSDHQLIQGLIQMLKQRDHQSSPPPFFLGMYNLETHAFQTIAKDGVGYPHKDDYILDTIHNYDHAFGKFWHYFQNSNYFENTVVIFTADHAHYPDRDFVSTFSTSADDQFHFVDEIPLIIFDPHKSLPATFDANYRNSIDFTPTVAHWLGLKNQQNPFIGRSIFEQEKIKQIGSIASADAEHYVISASGIMASRPDRTPSDEMRFVGNLVNSLRELEQHDRIWEDNR